MTNRRPPFESSRETLRHEHDMLGGLCDDLINRAESGDWHECDAVWDEFGRVLEAHMNLEEATFLPVFGAEGPEQALLVDRIRHEHQDIRRTVERLGVAVQVHTLRADDVRELVALLRRHAALEDTSLYAWAARAASLPTQPVGAAGPSAPQGQPGPG
jgi:hemerythrin HHE cation binding domain-containing protein